MKAKEGKTRAKGERVKDEGRKWHEKLIFFQMLTRNMPVNIPNLVAQFKEGFQDEYNRRAFTNILDRYLKSSHVRNTQKNSQKFTKNSQNFHISPRVLVFGNEVPIFFSPARGFTKTCLLFFSRERNF